MTGREFERIKEREGFTYIQLANALGVTDIDVSAWIIEKMPIPFWVVVGLGYMMMNVILGNPPERGVRRLLDKYHKNRGEGGR